MRRRFRRWWLGPLGASLGGLGISRDGHHLSYGTDGWGRYWLPDVVQSWIITGWNRWACRHLGHAWSPTLDGVALEAPILAEACSACGVVRAAPVPYGWEPTADPQRWRIVREAR